MDDRELDKRLNTIEINQLRIRQLLEDNITPEEEQILNEMYGTPPEPEEDYMQKAERTEQKTQEILRKNKITNKEED